MKKNWIYAILAIALVSCSNNQEPANQNSGKDVALSLNGSSETMITTKAETKIDLPASTPVGVYALETGTAPTTLVTTPFKNVLYTATGTAGGFTTTTPIYLQSTKHYTACAYAPLVENIMDVSAIPFVHGNDVMYAQQETVVITPGSPATASAAFTFRHKMSQIKFTLASGTGSPSLTGAVLSVKGFNASCTMDLSTGAITPIVGTGATVNEADKAICFIPNIPEMTLDVKVTTSDNRSYTGTITRPFSAANSYSFKITLNQNDSKLSITGQVVDWTPINGGDVSLEG